VKVLQGIPVNRYDKLHALSKLKVLEEKNESCKFRSEIDERIQALMKLIGRRKTIKTTGDKLSGILQKIKP